MIKKTLLGLLCILFIGCSTIGKYETKLNSWVGQSEEQLISSWGIPSATYQTNEGKLIMYQHNGGTVATGHPIGNMYYVNSVSYWCKTTFYVNSSGIITNWRWEGNACKSK